MSKRLIETITGSELTARIYWDSEWKEYSVYTGTDRPSGEAAYYTNDKQDALDTAKSVVLHADSTGRYFFNWMGGGYHSVQASSKEQARIKAIALGGVNLQPNLTTLRLISEEEFAAIEKSYSSLFN